MRTSKATANSLCVFDMKMSSADWEQASRPGQAGDRACEIPRPDLTLFLPGATALSPDLGAQKKDGGLRRRPGPDECRRGGAVTASALRRMRSCRPFPSHEVGADCPRQSEAMRGSPHQLPGDGSLDCPASRGRPRPEKNCLRKLIRTDRPS